MWKQTASLAVSMGLVATIGCDGTKPGVLDPTPLGTSFSSTVNIAPSIVTVQSISQPFCPTLPPFAGSLDLNVQATGDSRVSLSQVRMTFTDSMGSTAPPVTLPAPVMTQQFGSVLIEARSQRTFPLTFPFGCGTRRTGTLVIVVVVSDEEERETTAEARVAVR
jgi:hypothetical protein